MGFSSWCWPSCSPSSTARWTSTRLIGFELWLNLGPMHDQARNGSRNQTTLPRPAYFLWARNKRARDLRGLLVNIVIELKLQLTSNRAHLLIFCCQLLPSSTTYSQPKFSIIAGPIDRDRSELPWILIIITVPPVGA